MTRYRTRRKPMAEINMVPFIDIMMVMLVAFMVSAPMMTQGVKVTLPKTSSEPMVLPEEVKTLVISIGPDGGYFIDLGSEQERPRNIDLLVEQVQKVISASPATEVLVRGDESVAYGRVVELMSKLQSVGVPDVGLITDPEDL